MIPAWFNCPAQPATTASALGVAISVSDPSAQQLHLGLIYPEDGSSKVVHLWWHCRVANEPLNESKPIWWWVSIDVPEDRMEAIAGVCRRIIKRAENGISEIKYATRYEGGIFKEDGSVSLVGKEVGLTCATFVLAILHWAQLVPLRLDSWEARSGDLEWHARIVQVLKDTSGVSEEHLRAVEEEKGCARFRPADVAAACGVGDRLHATPLSFRDVRDVSRTLTKVLLPGSHPDMYVSYMR